VVASTGLIETTRILSSDGTGRSWRTPSAATRSMGSNEKGSPANVCRQSIRLVTENTKREPTEREKSLCPCKSRKTYSACCQPFHRGRAKPETAEQLMRSRFSAYFFRLTDYLVETTHPDTREPGLKRELEKTIHDVNWSFLKIVSVSKGGRDDKVGKVEFVAHYFVGRDPGELHERSRFRRYKGVWKYLDGKA